MYNKEQLIKDLRSIVNWHGNRVQEGFFTKGVYELYGITIVDRYIVEPEFWWGNSQQNLNDLSVRTLPGFTVMILAQKIDEAREKNSTVCV